MLNLKKNYLEKYQQIYLQYPEWNNIQYKLQLNLGNTNVKLKKVYCVANPYMADQFDKENKGMTIYQSYLKPDTFTGSNRLQRVCQKGFEFPNQCGLQFTIGQIDIDGDDITDYQILMVKICPRRIYPCFASEQTQDANFKIPNGFDSIYYREQNNEEIKIYRHRFKIFNKVQTLPYYVLQFSIEDNDDRHIKKIICQGCQDFATVVCQTQQAYLCHKCDYKQHKEKWSAKHVRKLMGDKPVLNFGLCKTHKNQKNKLFCKTCNRTICMSCKVNGDHSHSVMMEHQLQKISDFYNIILTSMKEMQPNLSKRKDQLQQLLSNLNNQMKDLNTSISIMQKQLTQMFQNSMDSLQTLARRKMAYILADELQIKRQYDYIEWMQSFLKYQYNSLNPDEFLKSWTKQQLVINRHEKLRKQILNISNIPAITEIKNNLKILAQIMIQDDGRLFLASSNLKGQAGGKNKQIGSIKAKIGQKHAKKENQFTIDNKSKEIMEFKDILFGGDKK